MAQKEAKPKNRIVSSVITAIQYTMPRIPKPTGLITDAARIDSRLPAVSSRKPAAACERNTASRRMGSAVTKAV